MEQRCDRPEKLLEIGSREFESRIEEVESTLLPRLQEFTDWVESSIAAKQLSHLDPEAETYESILSFLVQIELTHDLEDWVFRWKRVSGELKRAPAGRIAELQAKYAGIAETEGWGGEVETTEATPDLHEIVQRGFKAQNEGEGEEAILEELHVYIQGGGDLDKRDNSRMTALQRCKMLGWRAGRAVLEETLEKAA